MSNSMSDPKSRIWRGFENCILGRALPGKLLSFELKLVMSWCVDFFLWRASHKVHGEIWWSANSPTNYFFSIVGQKLVRPLCRLCARRSFEDFMWTFMENSTHHDIAYFVLWLRIESQALTFLIHANWCFVTKFGLQFRNFTEACLEPDWIIRLSSMINSTKYAMRIVVKTAHHAVTFL
jgi:hypothetical protein